MRGSGCIVLAMVVVGMIYFMTAKSLSVSANRPAITPSPPALGGTYLQTERISVSAGGAQAEGASRRGTISADGRWVAFSSGANNLTDDPQGESEDVFLRHRDMGEIVLISKGLNGVADGDSLYPRLSTDGGIVVWESDARNLVLSDTNDMPDVFWHDVAAEETIRLSVNSEGVEGNRPSLAPDVSGDGRVVAFESMANNLVLSDTNNASDIFVTSSPTSSLHYGEEGNPTGNALVRISMSDAGQEANGASYGARLSSDGRFVVFTSSASNLVLSDTNEVEDVFLYDRVTGVTERVSVATDGTEANRDSGGGGISDNGRYIFFDSLATNLDSQDTNQYQDIFRHDRITGITELVSISIHGTANFGSSKVESSADGRYVAFMSLASSLVPGDTNGVIDIFRKDMATGEVIRISESSKGDQGNDNSKWVSISGDGQSLVFESEASTLVDGDTNGVLDVFGVEVANVPFPTATPTATGTPTTTPTPTATATPTVTATPRIPPYPNEIMLPLVWRDGTSDLIRVRAITENADDDTIVAYVSAGGRLVLFESSAGNLVPGDTNASSDIFLWRHSTGRIERLSVNAEGFQANGRSTSPSLSRDGNWVIFSSEADNLVADDSNQAMDIFIRHLTTGEVHRVSVGMNGAQTNGHSFSGRISSDGQIVSFSSEASDLTPIPAYGTHIYWYQRTTGDLRLITIGTDGSSVQGDVKLLDMTPDGRYVLFATNAQGLTPNDWNGVVDIYRYDALTREMLQVSIADDESQGNAKSFDAEISANGQYVVFTSSATNLLPNNQDTNSRDDVFVRDIGMGSTERVSLTSTGVQIWGHGSGGGDISDTGRYVIWDSGAAYIVPFDNGNHIDTFWRDRVTGEVRLASETETGGLANQDANFPSLSSDGHYVIYTSTATNIVAGPGNFNARQVYWWRR